MTGFDYVVLILVGIGAVGGFLRGFVEEVLSLAAWCLALLAVHYLHEDLTVWLSAHLPTETGAGVLAFVLLLLGPYIATRMIARRMGSASRDSVVGPIDRLLGFGFGALKGFIIVVLGYSITVFGYDLAWGADGRPQWITQARTYPLLNAASEELLTLISERREQAADQAREAARTKARKQVLGD
ncbi:MAG: colicin V production protein [Novosphingobium sp. 28-62-57]|uniref:CvpA family protein n=1 Tax=Novosphingobium sp. 28-62-57 TaxID=1970409 RepID=UPI000BC8BBF5|nr:CvpA family protein [Novosphingobium sp. 28-62-57]OYW49578.1 MAG: colicin V production protein [Novosphingobium sp. 12-62-10]OYZ12466.1 MAG: colicin V production protein [Novosphingobium sp. 28-62-57]OYZ99053.1 MAG: colicin V production protein [Novosphingobium sp. 17-62-8]